MMWLTTTYCLLVLFEQTRLLPELTCVSIIFVFLSFISVVLLSCIDFLSGLLSMMVPSG